MSFFRVKKKGLVSTGWVGECVGHTLRHRTLRFNNGAEVTYNKNSLQLQPLEEEVEEADRSFIVVKERVKKKGGNMRPVTYKVHFTEASAKEEAIRLAKLNPNEAFQWLEIKGTVTNKQEVINTLEIV